MNGESKLILGLKLKFVSINSRWIAPFNLPFKESYFDKWNL